MYPVSAAFRAAVRASHIAISRAEIWSSGTLLGTIPIETGTVKINTQSIQRRTAALFLRAPRGSSLIPATAVDELSPFGNELRLYRGVQYPDGTQELAPLGVFLITNSKIIDGADAVQIEVDGGDRSLYVSNNKWTQPYQMAAGLLVTAITTAILDRYPDAIINVPATINASINQQVLGTSSGGDPWADLVSIAQTAGYDLFLDALGQFTLQAFPSIDGLTVDVSYVESQGNPVTEVEADTDTFQTYNGIIYVGAGSNITTPIRVEAWDTDPASPTYRFGKFGQRPQMIVQSLIYDANQALVAATALLTRSLGATQLVSWKQVPNPAADGFDVVFLQNTGTKMNRVVIIDTIDIPLEPTGEAQVKARTARLLGSTVLTDGQVF